MAGMKAGLMSAMNGKNGKKMSGKPQNVKGTLKRVFHYLNEYKLQFSIVVICIIVSAVANISGTYMIDPILTNLMNAQKIGLSLSENPEFFRLLITMVCIYALGVASAFGQQRLMVNITAGVLQKIRLEMFDHMQSLPIKYFDSKTHGEIMSTYTNDTDIMREMISSSIPQFISATTTILGFLVAMITLNYLLIVVSFLQVLTNIIIIKIIGGKSRKNFMAQQSAVAKVNGFVEELTEGQKVVKVFNHEEKIKQDFDVINKELATASTRANTYASILMPIMGNVAHVFYALTVVLGCLMVFNGVDGTFTLGFCSVYFTIASLITYLEYSRRFSMPITNLSQQMNSIFAGLAGAERIFTLIDTPSEVDDGYVTLVNANVDEKGNISESSSRTGIWAWKHPHKNNTVSYTILNGDVEFSNVNFGYEPNKQVLNNITLFAKAGQKIAFVGSTGAGKTTITNLINRFYDVPDGKIRYDGINVNKIKKDDLRKSLGVVLQDTHLFTGTVMDNIRYGRLDATDEECLQAAKLANADFFISHLPNQYQTLLTADGANLSQGQRQLIAIARAAVANPPVLILDEATSSIDTRTEKLIEEGMDKLMVGRTVFVIAHRLSTVRNSDAIMVLEHGDIIESGNHSQLLAKKGKYYELYTGMLELD